MIHYRFDTWMEDAITPCLIKTLVNLNKNLVLAFSIIRVHIILVSSYLDFFFLVVFIYQHIS